MVAVAANKNDGEWEVGLQIGEKDEFGSNGLIRVLRRSHVFMSVAI